MIVKFLTVALMTASIYTSKPLMAQDALSFPFSDIAAELEGKTRVPLRLPKFLLETGGSQIFAVVRHLDLESYDVLLAIGRHCSGGNVCTYGSLEGSSLPLQSLEGKVVPVVLSKEITGEFFPAMCSIFCSEAYITWKEDGFNYSIGVKAGKKKNLIRMARSAIASH